MARSIWNGCLGVGDLRVPVKLYGAVEDRSVRFREVHAADGAPLEHRRVDPGTGRVVDHEHVVRGFEVREGEFVVLDDDEVKAADGEHSKLVEIETFVPAEQVDPVLYDTPYYLGPRDRSEDGYRLLHDALAKAGRVGVGRIVLRTREQLVALRALEEGVLGLSTLRFAGEVVASDRFDVPEAGRAPGRREREMAAALVEQLSAPFDPADYADQHRAAVLRLVKRKASGDEIEVPSQEPEEAPDDLAAALEATLAQVGRARRRRGAHGGGAGGRAARAARRTRGEHPRAGGSAGSAARSAGGRARAGGAGARSARARGRSAGAGARAAKARRARARRA